MKVDLSIYNRILFDDLRPWLDSNKAESKFQPKLTPSFKNPKGGSIAFDKAINTALRDYSNTLNVDDYIFEIQEDNKKFKTLQDEIFQPLIEVEIEPPSTHKAEFYYYLIRNEATRLMNNLHKALQLSPTENEKKYLLTTTLTKINSFLTETEKQRKQLQKNHAENQQHEYIFTVLLHTLIRLHLEMRAIFEPLLGSKAFDEKGIYQNLLKDTVPAKSIVKDTVGLNNFYVKRYVNAESYSKQRTLDLINDALAKVVTYFSNHTPSSESVNRKAILMENVQALENLYFVQESGFTKERPSYEQLIAEDFTEEVFAIASKAITESIEEHTLPNKRIAVIEKEEQRLSFLQAKIKVDESEFTLSIPRKISGMLAGAKAFANANLSIDLSKIGEGAVPRMKTNLSVPQLAMIFKLIHDLKQPNVFDVKSDAELFRFISKAFITKKSGEEGISETTLRRYFDQPDHKAAEFWHQKFTTMVTQAKNIYKV